MTIMKNVISQLIDDFHERKLPELVNRNKEFSEVKGKADVVIGMRRSGKTWFCYQKIKELIWLKVKVWFCRKPLEDMEYNSALTQLIGSKPNEQER